MSQPKTLAWVLVFGAMYWLIAPAIAQNLDQGKSGARLFADSCATCHHSARGLAKNRVRLTLFLFLKDHYSTGSGSAWELASYLESVDTPQRGRSRPGSPKPSRSATWTGGPIRPPLPVPSH
jgi:hypothetical protein